MDEIDQQLHRWMAQALAGDAGAYRRLLAEIAPRLRRYFARRLHEPAEAEDLVQETLIAVHTKRETYDARLAFAPWLYAVARYKLIDHLRRRGVRRHVPLEEAGVLFDEADPEAGLARGDLDRLLAPLPARQRALLEDVKLKGMSVAEAAQRHGYSEGAAKVALHRTMKSLTARVAADED
ncbi:MAG: sigma-70 family RNA polymerase sigma factor [Pseudomonadota bacterium]